MLRTAVWTTSVVEKWRFSKRRHIEKRYISRTSITYRKNAAILNELKV